MARTYCHKCGYSVPAPISTHVCEEPKSQTLYAFWDYDICPYVLGGKVKEFLDDGRVRVEGYDGMAFRPLAILPGKAGASALHQLNELWGEYSIQEKGLKDVYASSAKKIILGG